MILHCKNAEMTISTFLQCKIIQFWLYFLIFNFFFLIWQFFTSEKIKKVKNKILFFF